MGNKRRIEKRSYSLSKLFSNKLGVSLVELLMGISLVGAGAFIIMNGFDYLDSRKTVVNRSASQEAIISGLMESIRTNISMEKIDYLPENFLAAKDYEDVKQRLNLCWLSNGVIPLESFPQCPGRIGYIVYPLKIGNLEYRGMYKVTIRIMHETLMPNRYKQYDFIVKD